MSIEHQQHPRVKRLLVYTCLYILFGDICRESIDISYIYPKPYLYYVILMSHELTAPHHRTSRTISLIHSDSWGAIHWKRKDASLGAMRLGRAMGSRVCHATNWIFTVCCCLELTFKSPAEASCHEALIGLPLNAQDSCHRVCWWLQVISDADVLEVWSYLKNALTISEAIGWLKKLGLG